MDDHNRFRIGVAGVGLMGSAVAKSLQNSGFQVSIWNRTATRCEPLSKLGAHVCDTVHGLANDSDILVLVVSDYDAAASLLEGVPLQGRLVISACSGPIGAAEALAQTVVKAGGSLLDCAIQNYPDQVGSERGLIVTAGALPDHERALPLMHALGEVRHAGTSLSAANALAIAYGAYVEIAVIGGMQAAALFESCGGDPAVLFDVAHRSRENIEGVLARLPSPEQRLQAPGPAVYADVAAHLEVADIQLSTASDLGADLSLLEAARRQLQVFAQSEFAKSDLEQCFRLLAPN